MQGYRPWSPLGTEAFQKGSLKERWFERCSSATRLPSEPQNTNPGDQAQGKMLTVLVQIYC